ncbi:MULTISPECIES: hypothetical protein [Bacillus]|uniref:hypothetical protein n=1 Tax=Bacillus TaxID=1386 RepID=UPI00032E61D6|nr:MULTISPECIES: hypothetical protein [Bacillus cereus group]EOP20132.1 hypothetical protein IIS_06068 [Bacillus cereus VD131]MBJ8044114.1 hypothetical protein [Bacillus cereus group sp. N17]HDR3907758.1 hypothetical protein [Bacillus toyonensis]
MSFFHGRIYIVISVALKDGTIGEEELLNKLMNSGIYNDYIVSIVGVTYLHLLLRNMI